VCVCVCVWVCVCVCVPACTQIINGIRRKTYFEDIAIDKNARPVMHFNYLGVYENVGNDRLKATLRKLHTFRMACYSFEGT